jgi:hypothetical protein
MKFFRAAYTGAETSNQSTPEMTKALMTRISLNLVLILSLVLAPLHHVLAMQVAPSSSAGCAEMSHHAAHTHSVDSADSDIPGKHAASDDLCNGCASCTHCSAAVTHVISIPIVSGMIPIHELRVPVRSADVYPDLRPPRLS